MPAYFQYATDWPPEQIADLTRKLAAGELHPNAAKRLLARSVVELYHEPDAGKAAEADFDRIFKAHEAPQEMPEIELTAGPRKLSKILVEAGLASSGREAVRLLGEGAVKIDGVPEPADREVGPDDLDAREVQVGKRKWARIRWTGS
jgi:tyrosyl-tRNA synthetase